LIAPPGASSRPPLPPPRASPPRRRRCRHIHAGLRLFPPRRNIIRLAPPLVIDEAQLQEATGIIKKVFSQL
jgi:acetylornithine/succinyldiaminopimelate/putrescine aminotransferase